MDVSVSYLNTYRNNNYHINTTPLNINNEIPSSRINKETLLYTLDTKVSLMRGWGEKPLRLFALSVLLSCNSH